MDTIHDMRSESPESLETRAFAGFWKVVKTGRKTALTTGLTTDRKIFDFRPQRGIIAKTEYPGVVQLIERAVWDREAESLSLSTRTKNLQHCCAGDFCITYFPSPKSVIIPDGITFLNFDFNRDSF